MLTGISEHEYHMLSLQREMSRMGGGMPNMFAGAHIASRLPNGEMMRPASQNDLETAKNGCVGGAFSGPGGGGVGGGGGGFGGGGGVGGGGGGFGGFAAFGMPLPQGAYGGFNAAQPQHQHQSTGGGGGMDEQWHKQMAQQHAQHAQHAQVG
jgi:hypothetical protein